MNKNAVGGLNFLRIFIISLTILIILLFAFTILAVNLNNSVSRNTISSSAVNESVTNPQGGGSHVSAVNLDSAVCGTFTKIYNGTNGVVINLANFTQTGCTFNNATNMASYGSTLLISYYYTYQSDSPPQNLMGNFTNGISSISTNVGTWLTLVGLVVIISIIAVVVGLVIKFGRSDDEA